MIEPDIDIYGGYARGSALADYLELLALSGKRCSRAQLEDAVKDRYGNKKRKQMIVDVDDLNEAGEFDDEEAELMNHVEEAFECLDERLDILADRYPFDVDDAGVALRSNVDVEVEVYVALLCLTAAHAYRLTAGVAPTVLFEELVASTLESRQLLVARIGDISRSVDGKFPETLKAAGEALSIPTVLGGAPFKRHANDMGADAVAHLSWLDRRLGRWTFVCQITCGDSNSWQRKMGEASPGLWAGWFAEQIDPLCGLAVPHHVPRRTLHMLVQEQRKIILDRLRLVLARQSVTADEVSLIKAVLAVDVDNVAAA